MSPPWLQAGPTQALRLLRRGPGLYVDGWLENSASTDFPCSMTVARSQAKQCTRLALLAGCTRTIAYDTQKAPYTSVPLHVHVRSHAVTYERRYTHDHTRRGCPRRCAAAAAIPAAAREKSWPRRPDGQSGAALGGPPCGSPHPTPRMRRELESMHRRPPGAWQKVPTYAHQKSTR